MILYQAHYSYGPGADDCYYYGGREGELYSNKKACEDEIDFTLHPDKYLSGKFHWDDIPIKGEIMEIEIKDSFTFDNLYSY